MLSWHVYEAAKAEVLRGRVTLPAARLPRGHSPTRACGCGRLCECALTALSSSKVIASDGRKHSAFRGRVRWKEHGAKLLVQGEVEKEINASMNSVPPEAGIRELGSPRQHGEVSPTASQPLPTPSRLCLDAGPSV